ncbi:unnamed protein product, partial [marine sediment metagenome]
RRGFQHTLESLDEDQTLLFTLLDADGITSREPVRLSLAVLPDQPPKLAVELQGIGSAVTPQARLPVEGEITDDYGLARVWFEYGIDQQKPATRQVDSFQDNLTEVRFSDALEVRDLNLTPGNKLALGVKAADRYNLAERPNVGTSSRWMLDVVSAEQLRAMLQSRELVLRQRFERIIQEVTESRDSLLRIDFSSSASGNNAGQTTTKEKAIAAEGAEPADESGKEEANPALQPLGFWKLRVERARQNGRKDALETLG